MRRFTVRPRPLQHQKKVRVYHLKNPDVLINENGDEVMINTVEDEGCETTVQADITHKTISIPTPHIEINENYDNEAHTRPNQPRAFIRYIPLSHENEENQLEYNVDEDDEEWLRTNTDFGENAPKPSQLSLDLFEKMIDCLEKRAGTSNSVPLDQAVTILSEKLQIKQDYAMVKQVREYWLAKRKKLGKPLLRRYWPETPCNDTNPHLVFRPREKPEKYRLRKHRKNEIDVTQRLSLLSTILHQSLELTKDIEKREYLKFRKIVLVNEILEQKIYEVEHPDGPEREIHIPEPFPYRKTFLRCSTVSPTPVVLSTYYQSTNKIEPDHLMMQDTEEVKDKTSITLPAYSSNSVPVSAETRFFNYLRSVQQVNGLYSYDRGAESAPIPTVAVNISNSNNKNFGYSLVNSSEISVNRNNLSWLTPNTQPSMHSSCPGSDVDIYQPVQSKTNLKLRTRVGRGGRLIIDRVARKKPFYAPLSTRYLASVPISSVQYVFQSENEEMEESPNPFQQVPQKRAHIDWDDLIRPVNTKRVNQEAIANASVVNQNSDGLLVVDNVHKLILNKTNNADQVQFVI